MEQDRDYLSPDTWLHESDPSAYFEKLVRELDDLEDSLDAYDDEVEVGMAGEDEDEDGEPGGDDALAQAALPARRT